MQSLLACIEGTSFASVLRKPEDTWKNVRLLLSQLIVCSDCFAKLQATFSQYARPSAGLSDIPGKGTLDRKQGQEQVMGYSIRTAQV